MPQAWACFLPVGSLFRCLGPGARTPHAAMPASPSAQCCLTALGLGLSCPPSPSGSRAAAPAARRGPTHPVSSHRPDCNLSSPLTSSPWVPLTALPVPVHIRPRPPPAAAASPRNVGAPSAHPDQKFPHLFASPWAATRPPLPSPSAARAPRPLCLRLPLADTRPSSPSTWATRSAPRCAPSPALSATKANSRLQCRTGHPNQVTGAAAALWGARPPRPHSFFLGLAAPAPPLLLFFPRLVLAPSLLPCRAPGSLRVAPPRTCLSAAVRPVTPLFPRAAVCLSSLAAAVCSAAGALFQHPWWHWPEPRFAPRSQR